jgi:anti-anti-sigma factor
MREPATVNDDAGILVVTGELDMWTAGIVRAAIAARPAVVAVDCARITFIDSAGFDAIVDPLRGRRILIVDPSPVVARLLDLFDRNDFSAPYDGPLVSAS